MSKFEQYTELDGAMRRTRARETLVTISKSKYDQDTAITTLSVTTAKGKWDGDEKSVNRMENASRKLRRAGDPTATIKWKMHNNKKVDVTYEDIDNALDEIADAMTAIIDG